MRLDTEIYTSRGMCQCTLTRTFIDNAPTIEADLWQSSNFLDSEFTTFRSCVHLTWNGSRYVIIRRKPEDHSNIFWLELENIISNTIIINE